jgi:hypothetical protein
MIISQYKVKAQIMAAAITQIASAAIEFLTGDEACKGLVANQASCLTTVLTVDENTILCLHRIFQHTFLEALDLVDREKSKLMIP